MHSRSRPGSLRARRLTLRGLATLATLASGLTAMPAWADSYPDRPVRLIVPFPAGGPTDIVARPLAQSLSLRLKQSVVVENKGGAGGTIAADYVAKAAADGYTLLVGTVGTQAINPALYKKLGYDASTDFTPLGVVAAAPVAIVVHARSPYTTLAELIAAAREKPAMLTFGSAGNGTPGHLTGELFASAAGIKFSHVPYRGSAPAVGDLLGQQIELMFDPVQSVLPHIQSGKLRALAVTGAHRSPVLPQVPTVAESGYRQFEADAWWAIYGPANLPAPVSGLLSRHIAEIVASPAFRERLASVGVAPHAIAPAAYPQFQRTELDKWGKAVRTSGATID